MFTKVIRDWYLEFGRDLPWRQTKDPYLIWISEIILQQTRVNQGYNYYLKFAERFPTVEALAQADEDEVLKYWQGLGYYSRARNLHTAAKSIVGSFPRTYDEVISLKGVGEYTAAAICSFAYDLPYAVVDGNVYRVLSRYFGIETPIDTGQGKREFATLAQELLDKQNPGQHNHAIMDFGATQCTPKSPDCSICPLADSCFAFQNEQISLLPIKKGKTKVTDRYFNFFYIEQGEFTYIIKRTGNDIWRNLYQFPLVESDRSLNLADLLLLEEAGFLKDQTTEMSFELLVEDFKHILSHQRLHATLYKVVVPTTFKLDLTYLKILRSDIDLYAVPRLIHLFIEKNF